MLRKATLITLALALVAGTLIFTGCNSSSITGAESESATAKTDWGVQGFVTEEGSGDPLEDYVVELRLRSTKPLIGSFTTIGTGYYRIPIGGTAQAGWYTLKCIPDSNDPPQFEDFYFYGTGDEEVDFEF